MAAYKLKSTCSTKLHDKLDYPVIDTDGHVIENTFALPDFLKQVAGPDMVAAYTKAQEAARQPGNPKRVPWGTPSGDLSIDRATMMLPRLYALRLEEAGVDFSTIYATIGFNAQVMPDDEIRQAACRALNMMYADMFKEVSHKMTPAAIIPMNTPEESIAEVEFAVTELGMKALMQSRFPQDTVDYVGFYSTACRIKEKDLPLVMPKPVTIHDYQVRLRVPLDQAQSDKVPQHFTNLQLGLRLARQILTRRGAANKQIFIITDGQPTAHVEYASDDGEILYLLYPPTERTSTATLKEALRCKQQGIAIATFALIEDYWGMDWVGFVDQLTRLTRGTAYYCSSDDLSSTVIESYLDGKKRKSFIA